MKHAIRSAEDLGLAIRAVRKSTRIRQDDLAAVAGVSRQFTVDAEKGKPTIQFGRVLRLLAELGIDLTVDIPENASRTLVSLRERQARKKDSTAPSPAADREPAE